MNDEYEQKVLEGFICPICMKDLKSVHQLQSHFDEEHGTEDKVVLQSIKDFLSRASKKILKSDDADPGFSSKILSALPHQASLKDSNNPWNWGCPKIDGRSHSLGFKKLRSARIDSQVAETNKLLIRLDKILTNIPSDPTKRKAHERNIVFWAEDSDVPLCPYCAKTFNITKRRHHCRLCGAVMCDDCSQNLTFSFAEKLVNPIHHGEKKNMSVVVSNSERKSGNALDFLIKNVNTLKKAGSHGSLHNLLSMVDFPNKDRHFRTCQDCMKRLLIRDHQTTHKEGQPVFSLYYGKLMEQRSSLSEQLCTYNQMSQALNNGDRRYTLNDAIDLRSQIMKLSDDMHVYAQKIRDYGKDDQVGASANDAMTIGVRQLLLQRRIYSTIVSFLKENILSLAKLPDKDEYERRVLQKRDEAESRFSSRCLPPDGKLNQTGEVFKMRTNDTFQNAEVNAENGWSGDVAAHFITETDDPIIQQMNIIRAYIKQAREAGRQSEVDALEANLKELQVEYRKQKQLTNT